MYRLYKITFISNIVTKVECRRIHRITHKVSNIYTCNYNCTRESKMYAIFPGSSQKVKTSIQLGTKSGTKAQCFSRYLTVYYVVSLYIFINFTPYLTLLTWIADVFPVSHHHCSPCVLFTHILPFRLEMLVQKIPY